VTAPVPLATDQPISSSADDRFSRKLFAYRAAQTIAHRADPTSIVVGIYGSWGEGKTSVLRMIDEGLASEKHVKSFWFNPWRTVMKIPCWSSSSGVWRACSAPPFHRRRRMPVDFSSGTNM
jgi:hypothetical protein